MLKYKRHFPILYKSTRLNFHIAGFPFLNVKIEALIRPTNNNLDIKSLVYLSGTPFISQTQALLSKRQKTPSQLYVTLQNFLKFAVIVFSIFIQMLKMLNASDQNFKFLFS